MRTRLTILGEHTILILFTPQTPRSFLIFGCFLALSLLPFKVSSQNNTELFSKRYDSYLNRNMEIELKPELYYSEHYLIYADSLLSFNLKEQTALKRKWWYYLPTLGFSFGKPSINFSSSVIANIDFENEKRKIQKEKILKSWEHETADILKEIQTTVRILELDLRELELIRTLQLYDREFLFDFKKSKEAGLLTDIEYLNKEKAYQEVKFKTFQKEKSIFEKIKALEKLAHVHTGLIHVK